MSNPFKKALHWVGDQLTGHHETPDPRKFASMQSSSTPNSPMNTTPPGGSGSPLPLATTPGGGDPHQAAFMNAARSNPDLQGVIDTIGNLGGDAWGFISKFLPKNGDGSVDWGKVGGDIAGFISSHKGDILAGASVYEAAVRQGKSDKYAQAAVDQVTKDYAAKQPLRDAGISGMLDPSKNAPDLTALKQQAAGTGQLRAPIPLAGGTNLPNLQQIAGPQSGNPFAKALPLAPPSPQAPQGPATPPVSTMPAGPMKPPPQPIALAGPPTPQGPTMPPVAPAPLALAGLANQQGGTPTPGAPKPGTPPLLLPGQKPPNGWTLPLAAS